MIFRTTNITEEWDWVDIDHQLVNQVTTKTVTWFGLFSTKIRSSLVHTNFDKEKASDKHIGFKTAQSPSKTAY